jgi:putative phosphoesterase
MKIAVLSDTHLHQITREFKELYRRWLADKDMILHAGDIVSTEIIDFLSKNPFHGVYGNMDPAEVQVRLPSKKVLEVGSYRLGLIHGWGSSTGLEDRIWPEFHNVDVIIYGHSHHAVRHVREGVLVFNPGTATGYSSSGVHTMGVLDLSDGIRSEIIML